MNILNKTLTHLINRVNAYRLVRRADNPYATHLPILIGIGGLFKIKHVLELGSGSYSTSIFSDKSIFPALISLQSLENDSTWLHKITDLIERDSRITLTLVNGSISAALKNVALEKYDLIFVDDSANETERAATIAQVTQKVCSSNIVIIHDYEVESYREASKGFTNRFVFEAFNPKTGVLWNNASVDKHSLNNLDRLFKRYSKRIDAEDIHRWVQILDKFNGGL